MINTITLTQKGQVAVDPAKDFLSLQGSVKSPQEYSDPHVDKKILAYVKKHYEK